MYEVLNQISGEVAGELTLGDLVTALPAAARVFERHGLDYCCGGGRRLSAACHEAGIDVGAVLVELATLDAASAEDWAAMTPLELVDHIEQRHHAYLWRQLPVLAALVSKVADVHGGRHPELDAVAATFEELRADLEPHLEDEERVLFPMIRQLVSSIGWPIADMGDDPMTVLAAEHDRVGELLARLRTLTDGYQVPTDGCASYRSLYQQLAELEADTHLHVHKENNVLFPAARG